MLMFEAPDAMRMPLAVWRGTLPYSSGINNVLRQAHSGRIAARWFSPRQAGEQIGRAHV